MVRDIGLVRLRLAAAFLDFGDDRVGLIGRVAVMDGDGRAFRRECQRNLAPDVPGAAGDQGDAILEVHVHGCAFLCQGECCSRPLPDAYRAGTDWAACP